MKKILLSILGITALAVSASAQTVIFNDTFTSGNITGWYSAGATGSSVSAFNNGGGQEWLSVNSSNATATGQHAFKAFTGTTLAVGETMRLTMNVAQINSMPNANNSFGVALFNTSSSYSADQNTASVWAIGSQGYRFFLASGTNTGSTLGWANLGAVNTPWAGGSNNAATSTAAAGTLATGNLVFDIARTGLAELQFTVTNGATTLYNAVSSTAGTTPEYFTFNTLAAGYLTSSAATRSVRFDTVNLSVIPEPTTWALLAGSLTTMMVFRRRRRA